MTQEIMTGAHEVLVTYEDGRVISSGQLPDLAAAEYWRLGFEVDNADHSRPDDVPMYQSIEIRPTSQIALF